MPELPEVETIRQDMIKKIKGKTIHKVEVKSDKSIKLPSVPEFIDLLEGETVTDIKRRGKYLTLTLSSGRLLIFHLKLTGRLLYLPEQKKTLHIPGGVI